MPKVNKYDIIYLCYSRPDREFNRQRRSAVNKKGARRAPPHLTSLFMPKTSQKALLAAALILIALGSGLALAADVPAKNFYSAFGVENADPDMDGVYANQDKCPSTPFNFAVINAASKKQTSGLQFSDPKNPGSFVELKLKKIADKEVTLAVGKKQYVLSGSKIAAIDAIAKRAKVIYSHADKKFVVLWIAGLGGKTAGCTVEEK